MRTEDKVKALVSLCVLKGFLCCYQLDLGITVQYSKRKAKMLRDKEISLQKKVNLLQAQAEENPHNKNITHELEVEKSRLNKIYDISDKRCDPQK